MTIEGIMAVAIGILGVAVTVIISISNGYRARLKDIETEIRDIRKDYVRRDDLNDHLAQIDRSVGEVKDGMKELTKLVLTAIASTQGK